MPGVNFLGVFQEFGWIEGGGVHSGEGLGVLIAARAQIFAVRRGSR